jgi:hypothetical protein
VRHAQAAESGFARMYDLFGVAFVGQPAALFEIGDQRR